MELKKKLKKYGVAFLCIFTTVFMWGIFGPTEIFLGNYMELGVVYSEFGFKFLGIGVVISLLVALIISLLPEILFRGVLGIITGVNVASYLQSMFFNKGLGLVGVTAEGYVPDANKVTTNAIIWGTILIVAVLIAYIKHINVKKIYALISTFLLMVQLIAFGTLFISANEAAFEYQEGELTFDMTEQLTVSSEENIIFLLFDTVPNTWIEAAAEVYPDLFSVVKDFTYFNDADCGYLGTYPSMVHMLTGNPFDTALKTNDYFAECWDNEKTNAFYELLKEKNYKVNIYAEDPSLVVGWDTSLEMIQDKVSNIVSENATMMVNYPKLYEVMIKLSAFRYAPNGAKTLFNVAEAEYSGIVSYPGNEMYYLNSAFYERLAVDGIKVSRENNYFIFKHFNGVHEFLNDEDCKYLENATREQTIKGIFTLIGEYLTQLQELGVYDNSTIIILADHGISVDTQPMFFIKRKNETHDEVQVSTAPITYDELIPTIVEVLDEEHSSFGLSIYDIKEGEARERVYYERALDEDYPSIINSRGIKANGGNVWRKYIYVGDRSVMRKMYERIYEVIPMVDSYY